MSKRIRFVRKKQTAGPKQVANEARLAGRNGRNLPPISTPI
jgi:hypothetical protein